MLLEILVYALQKFGEPICYLPDVFFFTIYLWFKAADMKSAIKKIAIDSLLMPKYFVRMTLQLAHPL